MAGWNQGIVGTILNLGIYAFGIVLSFKMAPVTSAVLERMFDSNHPMMFVGAFLANLLFIYIIVHLATRNIEDALAGMYLGTLNRVIGATAIGGFYVMLYSILLWFLAQANGLSQKTLSESRTYPFLQPLPGHAKQIAIRLQPIAVDSWTDFNQWLDKAQKYGIEKTDGKGKVYELPEPDGKEPLFESKPSESTPARPRPQDSNPIEDN